MTAPDAPSGPDARVRTRALAVSATVLVVAALKLSEPVTLPLVFAAFLIAFTYPLYGWIERRTRTWVAVIASTLVVLLAFAVAAGAVVLSVAQVAEHGPALMRRLTVLGPQLRTWLTSHGLPASGGGGALGGATSAANVVLRSGGETLTMLGLTLAYYVLGILEVPAFRDKQRTVFRPHGEGAVEAARGIAHRVRGYLWAVTITSLLAGVAAGLFALAVGLDGALTWGLATFLLNYIQTIGPFLSVIPPTLYALIQGGETGHGAGWIALVFFGLGAIQFVIGNFIDPKVAGSKVRLSALVVLVAVTFWGWVWGAVGALLAVPLTVAVAAVCERFARTRWVAILLGDQGTS